MPRKDKDAQLKYQREWYSKGRAYIDFVKSQSKCVHCNYNEDTKILQFHHVEPGTKKFPLAKGGQHRIQEIVDEMAKCIILCPNCHEKLHIKLGYKTW